MRPLPFARSYWVVPGKFLAGCYPGSADQEEATAKLTGLISVGVTRVVSLMEATETNRCGLRFVDYGPEIAKLAETRGRVVDCFRHPIADGSVPTLEMMTATLDRIDESIEGGGLVYGHCWGGRGRTGTTVCCWMIRHRLVTPAQAIERLQFLVRHNAAAFHPTPENDLQRAFVRAWAPGN